MHIFVGPDLFPSKVGNYAPSPCVLQWYGVRELWDTLPFDVRKQKEPPFPMSYDMRPRMLLSKRDGRT